MDSSSILSLTVVAGAVLLLFGGCAFVIKRFLVNKQYFGGEIQFIGRQVVDQFNNADKRAALDHVIYVEEDEREDHFVAENNPSTRFTAK
ncbi:MAG: hypothetical protein KKA42_14920 [candidate division Zixibacteria bacterium]|nr:hypothetical protein [candidate division Zixibacteria bacterium]